MAWDEKSIMDFLNGNHNQFNNFLKEDRGCCRYSLQNIDFLIYWCVGDTCELWFPYRPEIDTSCYSPIIEFFNAAKPIIDKKLKASSLEKMRSPVIGNAI